MSTRKPLPSYNTVDVFVAACAAQRILGTYRKETQLDENDNLLNCNKNVARDILNGGKYSELVTDEDITQSNDVIQYCRSMTFKVLSGAKLNAFEEAILKLVDMEQVSTNFQINTITSIPNAYLRGMARKSVESRIRAAEGYVATVGERIELKIEVVRSVYSQKFGIWFVTGITEDNKAVFFAHYSKINSHTMLNIRCRVKAHRENNTQLNYVRILT